MAQVDENIKFFMQRFNCACKRIKKLGYAIHTNLGLNIHLSKAHQCYMPDARAPLGLLLLGHRIKKSFPHDDIEDNFKLPRSVIDCFNQGFMNASNYRDIWGGFNQKASKLAYHRSLMFNMGRAFLEKFCGIYLDHQLPSEYYDYFKKLG